MELSDVAVFIKVIQAGSFTEAARRLGAPKSTVSSKVSGLERRLGITLLQRTTRKLHLTDEGETFFQSCARALGEIEAAEAVAASGQKSPQGRVSVTAPNDTGKLLATFLKGFRKKYPGVSVDLLLTNRYVDLIGEGVDVAIRAGNMQDSTLMARKVATTRRALFASPGYLAAAGPINHPKDLSGHQCILFSAIKSDRWRMANGKQRAEVKVDGAVSADDIAALKELALQDLGVALIPTFICRDDVHAKRLVPVLPGWASDSSSIYVVYPGQKFQHPKIKVFVEEIAKLLADTYGSADKVCGANHT